MGVLGWPPRIVMEEAGLSDLRAAKEGHDCWHGDIPRTAALPDAGGFLKDMMKRFPDQRR
jgi:hypothetical protein